MSVLHGCGRDADLWTERILLPSFSPSPVAYLSFQTIHEDAAECGIRRLWSSTGRELQEFHQEASVGPWC